VDESEGIEPAEEQVKAESIEEGKKEDK
jgi:hypothetical protein